MEHPTHTSKLIRAFLCSMLLCAPTVAEAEEVLCQLSGRIVYDTKPPRTRFRVYVYAGKDAAHTREGILRHFLTNTDRPATFGKVFPVDASVTHLSVYYELESTANASPVTTFVFREPKDTPPLRPRISGLETTAYSTQADSPTLRIQAVRLANTSPQGSEALFDLAFAQGSNAAEKVEAVRVKARTVVNPRKSPADALGILEAGTEVPNFEELPETYRVGYWKERNDYFERFVFARGFGRDRDGSFSSAIAKDVEIKTAWERMTQDWEQSPPRASAPSLALTTSVAEQQQLLNETLTSGFRAAGKWIIAAGGTSDIQPLTVTAFQSDVEVHMGKVNLLGTEEQTKAAYKNVFGTESSEPWEKQRQEIYNSLDVLRNAKPENDGTMSPKHMNELNRIKNALPQ